MRRQAGDLRDGQNPGANFFLFTEAPIAGHIVGFVLDDTANEFDPNSPTFGEKYAPPFMPVSVRDWTGREIVAHLHRRVRRIQRPRAEHVHGQRAGAERHVAQHADRRASTRRPRPATGAARPALQPAVQPLLLHAPVHAGHDDLPRHAGAAHRRLRRAPTSSRSTRSFPSQTPVITQVTNVAPLERLPRPLRRRLRERTREATRPEESADESGEPSAARTIVITSVGSAEVPNPYYDGLGGTQPKMITRDYGFGDGVTVGAAANRPNGVVRLNGVALSKPASRSGPTTQITAMVPSGLNWRTGQLSVDRCLARTGGEGAAGCTEWRPVRARRHPDRGDAVDARGEAARSWCRPAAAIQAAINSAAPGALILVPPGNYEEMVVMTKPVRLQGWGAAVTRINVVQSPAENLQAWRDFVGGVLTNTSYLLPDQVAILGAPPFADGVLAATLGGEGGGVTVLGKSFPAGNTDVPVGNLNGYCGPPVDAASASTYTGGLLTAARLLQDFGLSSGAGGERRALLPAERELRVRGPRAGPPSTRRSGARTPASMGSPSTAHPTRPGSWSTATRGTWRSRTTRSSTTPARSRAASRWATPGPSSRSWTRTRTTGTCPSTTTR